MESGKRQPWRIRRGSQLWRGSKGTFFMGYFAI